MLEAIHFISPALTERDCKLILCHKFYLESKNRHWGCNSTDVPVHRDDDFAMFLSGGVPALLFYGSYDNMNSKCSMVY